VIGVAYGDSAYALFDVVNALKLEDERVVIADAGARRLQFYDGEGRFLKTVGTAASYGRDLQESALQAWAGQTDNVPAARQAFHHTAKCNGAARSGS
jgi:hypothetical protein